MSLLIPWFIFLTFAIFIAGLLIKRFQIRKSPSLLLALSIVPFLTGQFLYLLYNVCPKSDNNFYLLTTLAFITVLVLLSFKYGDLTYLKIFTKFKIPKNSFMDKIYLITIIAIIIFVFIRMLFWPLVWGDQIEYYFTSHALFVSKSSWTDIKHPLSAESISGVRPGIPMVVNFLALFDNNNLIIEKQIQIIIFYYLICSIILIYFLVNNQTKKRKISLFAVSIILTCFNFINFSIYGFKEVILIVFLLLVFYIFKDNNVNNIYKKGVLSGIIFGLISFIHMSGVVYSFFIFVSIVFFSKIKLKKKVLLGILILIIWFLMSSGEVEYFIRWIITGFKLPDFLQKVFYISRIEYIQSYKSLIYVNSNNLSDSFGIVALLDQIIKGKLQIFTQFQYYGLIFWFLLTSLIIDFRNIIKYKINMIVGSFLFMSLILIFNPFSIFNHNYAYVLYTSPKYYLTLLPIAIVFVSRNYQLIQIKISKISIKWIYLGGILIFTFGIMSYLLSAVLIENASFLIPLNYQNNDYYIGKLQILSLLIILTSSILIISLYLRRRFTVSFPLRDFYIFIVIFLLPFLFFLNNNYDIISSFIMLSKNRDEKVELVNKATIEEFKLLSYILKNYHIGEKILMTDMKNSKVLNYYLVTKFDLMFRVEEIPILIKGNTNDNFYTNRFDWIINFNDSDKIQKYIGFYSIDYSNKEGNVLKLNE